MNISMRKFALFVLLAGMIACMIPEMVSAQSQSRIAFAENFDGNSVSFTASPTSAWGRDATLFSSPLYGYRGKVPNTTQTTTYLESPVYNLTGYSFAQISFRHICKVSPLDSVRIEYKITGMTWTAINDPNDYMGDAIDYRGTGFSAATYPEWRADDSTLIPDQTWWKEESFDVGFYVGGDNAVQFRFVIEHRATKGTQISYGWLIDDFELIAATYDFKKPVVEFLPPLVNGTVYSTGPFDINAKIQTKTMFPLVHPKLEYTATKDGSVVKTDSIPMDNVSGDTLWKASIPRYELGTQISYSILGQDSGGNGILIASSYVIDKLPAGQHDVIIQTGGTDSEVYPFNTGAGYSRSMSLYTADEVSVSATERISKIALRVATPGSGAIPIKIWLKTVPASKTAWNAGDNAEWSDLTQPATLVYDSLFDFAATGWVDVPLIASYAYTPTENLVVMFEQNCGGNSCSGTSPEFYYSTTATDKFWMKSSDGAPPVIGDYAVTASFHPDLRVTVYNTGNTDNSAAVVSIDMSDTLPVGPSIPIIATIKNVGDSLLTSATIYYSVNGVDTQTYNFTGGSLLWDYDFQDTIGYYSSKINGNDTIAVWVSMPNGTADNITFDDKQIKVVYGITDIVITFVDFPSNIERTTGPFPVSARITTFSGNPVGTVPLYLLIDNAGTITHDTLTMVFDPVSGLYKASIPNIVYGTDVSYSIALTDANGNEAKVENTFSIERPAAITGYVIVGTGTEANYNTPVPVYYGYGWTRQVYKAYEINPASQGAIISKLAWEYNHTAAFTATNQVCYFRAVDDSTITTNAYLVPLSDGATQVWSGTFSAASGPGWVEITLDDPFVLPPNKNLLIYWTSSFSSSYTNKFLFSHHTATNMAIVGQSFSSFPTGNGTMRPDRANVRFYLTGSLAIDTSVSLMSIESPLAGTVNAGTSIPVRVRIRNTGKDTLTSCEIHWTHNGTNMTTAQYTGKALPEDFTDTITIGYYTPVDGIPDNFTVWVSMPNGIIDSLTSDDTLQVSTIACPPNGLSGDYVIGTDFASFEFAFSQIAYCGIDGKLRLLVNGDHAEEVDFSVLSNVMTSQDTLVLTSQSGDALSASIKSSGTAITLAGNRNIIIHDITVDASTSASGYTIRFASACTNIVIRDCRLLAHPTSTSNTGIIDKPSGTGIAESIFIINNYMEGGDRGFNFFAGIETNYGKHIVFDSNTVIASEYAVFGQYIDFQSCSYNTLQSRTANTESGWTGVYMFWANGHVIGNRIIQRSTGITTPYGIRVRNYNHAHTSDTGLIANNEIILNNGSTSASDYSGIFADVATHARILHNSVYMTGIGRGRGIRITDNADSRLMVKNNNIVVLTATDAYPIYLAGIANLQNWDLDFNNMYAPSYVGFAVTNKSNIEICNRQYLPTSIRFG
jgi:hypothetical protein